jgi:uncharacterized protein YjbI with pentapeptide repeats
MEILLGALAEAILSIIANDLAQQPKLATLRERLRGNSREKLALQRALVKAFYSFKHRYPELSASFFDEYFLQQPQVISELAKILTPNKSPDTLTLTQLWKAQFGNKPDIDLSQPLSYFLNEFQEEVKSETLLKSFIDSRALEQLYAIADRVEQQVATQEEIRDILLEILWLLMREQKVSPLFNSRMKTENLNKDQKLTPAEQYQITLHWAENGRKESQYGFDLRGCVLWGLDLERADLRMANLCNADLGRANLQKANLGGADLRGANLFNTFLHGAKIDDTTQIDYKLQLVLEIIEIGGGVKRRNLRRVDLSNTVLVWGELSEADLREANLSGCTLSAAKLRGAKLAKANLSGADLSMADLQGADLREANLSSAELRQANLSKADLRGANLTDATLVWGDSTVDGVFPGNLTGAKYNDATVWPGNFNPAKQGMVFQD